MLTDLKQNVILKVYRCYKGVKKVKVDIFCPDCAKARIRRKLLEVDAHAKGIIYPYCKGCKENKKIDLDEVLLNIKVPRATQ